MPVIKAAPDFDLDDGIGIIEGDKYNLTSGQLDYLDTNVFCRQIRNLVIDTTNLAPDVSIAGVHWPSAQATSVQNVVFQLSEEAGNKHVGIFMEGGSGGYLGDIVFWGGQIGAQFGNQQYTTRNLTFYNCQTAIQQLWDWFWVYKDLTITNCGVGINMTASSVGSAIILDSVFYETTIGIATNISGSAPGNMQSQGSIIMERVNFGNVGSILQDTTNAEIIQGSGYNATYITGYVQVCFVDVMHSILPYLNVANYVSG